MRHLRTRYRKFEAACIIDDGICSKNGSEICYARHPSKPDPYYPASPDPAISLPRSQGAYYQLKEIYIFLATGFQNIQTGIIFIACQQCTNNASRWKSSSVNCAFFGIPAGGVICLADEVIFNLPSFPFCPSVLFRQIRTISPAHQIVRPSPASSAVWRPALRQPILPLWRHSGNGHNFKGQLA